MQEDPASSSNSAAARGLAWCGQSCQRGRDRRGKCSSEHAWQSSLRIPIGVRVARRFCSNVSYQSVPAGGPTADASEEHASSERDEEDGSLVRLRTDFCNTRATEIGKLYSGRVKLSGKRAHGQRVTAAREEERQSALQGLNPQRPCRRQRQWTPSTASCSGCWPPCAWHWSGLRAFMEQSWPAQTGPSRPPPSLLFGTTTWWCTRS